MKKIAIVGTAATYVEAPYNDNTWQIWSLGANWARIPRFNKWFEIHTLEALRLANALDDKRLAFLKKIGGALVIGHETDELPLAEMYPLEELKAEFGAYFTSSISYMIALAIHEGADEIGIWGVDMIGDGEYAHQRPCCEYLLGVAKGRGIKVTIAPKSPLLRCERLYGFEYTQLAGETQENIAKMRAKLARAEDNYITALEERAYCQGALSVLHDIERRWG